MGLERPQNPADRPVAFGARLQRGRDVAARFDDDRNDDVVEALAGRLPHDAPDGLDDIDLAVFTMSASAKHFERRMPFANAMVRGSLPGCSKALPSVTPFTTSDPLPSAPPGRLVTPSLPWRRRPRFATLPRYAADT